VKWPVRSSFFATTWKPGQPKNQPRREKLVQKTTKEIVVVLLAFPIAVAKLLRRGKVKSGTIWRRQTCWGSVCLVKNWFASPELLLSSLSLP
jgi:hypothetical protein